MSTDIQQLDVKVNGEPQEVPAGSTLPDLLRRMDIDPAEAKGIAVAVNDEVVRREAWANVTLDPGDRIEVVTATQGG